MAIKVLFHSYSETKHCPDGFGAMVAAKRYFGDDAEYIPVQHLTKEQYQMREGLPQIESGDNIYILDFCYPADILEEWRELGTTIIVIDHHKGNRESLVSLNWVTDSFRELCMQADNNNSVAFIDLSKSGAELAWKYFFPNKHTPWLIQYVGDRDTWKKALPFTEEIHRGLSSLPQTFEVWNTLIQLDNYPSFMKDIGEPIWQEHCKQVDQLCLTAIWKTLLGYEVLTTNTSNYSLVSDTLNKICRDNLDTPFAVNYRLVEGKLKFEFRSIGDFDVSTIAKKLGGGGHQNSSGALIELNNNTFDLIKDFV